MQCRAPYLLDIKFPHKIVVDGSPFYIILYWTFIYRSYGEREKIVQ